MAQLNSCCTKCFCDMDNNLEFNYYFPGDAIEPIFEGDNYVDYSYVSII